jgi:two-component system, OmpR family, sensor histidine kinase ArlS
MNLKQRFALYFSVLFTVVLGAVLLALFSMYYKYRVDEFQLRLVDKATTSVNLLVDLEDEDKQILRNLDQNSINKLYSEKIVIFNSDQKLIYSSLDDAVVKWQPSDFEYLKSKKQFFRHDGVFDVIGIYIKSNDKPYYVFVAAEDVYGNRKLEFLTFALLTVFGVGVVLVWLLSYYVSKRSFAVLDELKDSIAEITDKELMYRLKDRNKKDEVDALAKAFNSMMDRLDVAYRKQKEFIYNASHELRTPVSRLLMQLQNLIQLEEHSPATDRYLTSLLEDANQMTEIISSLLLLSKIDENEKLNYLPLCRIDEVIFEAMQSTLKTYPDFHIRFNIENITKNEDLVEVKGDYSLLKIVFLNLLKNACIYSSDNQVDIRIIQEELLVKVIFTNNGSTLSELEKESIFKAFSRGENSRKVEGTGLGLRIVERILYYHHAEISYDVPNENVNQFTVSFRF